VVSQRHRARCMRADPGRAGGASHERKRRTMSMCQQHNRAQSHTRVLHNEPRCMARAKSNAKCVTNQRGTTTHSATDVRPTRVTTTRVRHPMRQVGSWYAAVQSRCTGLSNHTHYQRHRAPVSHLLTHYATWHQNMCTHTLIGAGMTHAENVRVM
jgi:hypothetical protein